MGPKDHAEQQLFVRPASARGVRGPVVLACDRQQAVKIDPDAFQFIDQGCAIEL
jgi:hypothetical protein